MALRKVSTIVESALLDIGENGKSQLYPRFLNWALEEVRNINYDIAGDLKSVKIDVLPNNTVPFPDDYVNYTRLGVIKNNYVELLKRNDEIPLFDETSDSKTTAYVDRNRGYEPFYNPTDRQIDTLDITGAHYGIGSGHAHYGSFRVDKKHRRFMFDSTFTESQIVLEYFSNGLNCNGGTLVDEMAERVIKEYIKFMWIRMDRTSKAWEVRDQEERYFAAKRVYKERVMTPTLKEILDTVRRNYFQAPKI